MREMMRVFGLARSLTCAVLVSTAGFGFCAGSATIAARPSYIDLASATSEGAVKITLSGYTAGDAPRFRLYNGSNQYNPWDNVTNTYISSTSYTAAPLAPGDYVAGTTFWSVFQRGNNATTIASYRDRIGTYTANNNTVALPAATAIATPYSLTGTFPARTGLPTTTKYVVLGYDATTGGNLISAAATEYKSDNSNAAFTLVCPTGTTIQRIETRKVDDTLVDSVTGTWSSTTNIGTLPVALSVMTVE